MITPRFDRDSLPQGAHKARGVVLRRRDGSAGASKSLELLLFLSSLGAMWVGAPGAGGAKNRFGGGTEPMMWGDFELYQSPRKLYLKGVDVREDFWSVRGSKASLTTALDWHGKIAKKISLATENDALLSLLYGSMKNLASGASPQLADVRFAWRWANIWGVAPPLDFCASCGKNFFGGGTDDFVYLSTDGVLCERCGAGQHGLRQIDGATHRVIYHASNLSRDDFSRMTASYKINPSDTQLWRTVSDWLYSFI